MHGDRYYGDDGAIMGGVCYFRGMPVTVIAQVKGRNLDENKSVISVCRIRRDIEKHSRLAKQAEKFHRPVICFIDTSGAYPGVEAEKARTGVKLLQKNIIDFMTLKVPVISIVLGEGGSGGALALGVCDELAMLENAIYSVISPQRICIDSLEGSVKRA